MKDITPKLVKLFKTGYCTPQIARVAKKLQEPSTTLHYNIKKLEKEGAIKEYKAVFNHKKIEEGFCVFVLINLSPDEYGDPERVGRELVNIPEIESIDILTGDWEMVLKIRTKDQDEYYELVKNVLSRKGIIKMTTLTSLKQIKSEFIKLE
ncbi:MAG: Lrp/AsnC family transcriptional regulator [archaeon]